MENYINDAPINPTQGELALGKKVLIATVYKADPVLLAAMRLGPERLILLIDKEPDEEQSKALKLIQESLGKVVDVKTVKTEVYDIVKIAEKCVEVIDQQPRDDLIYVNVTSGRKTKAMGLLFAAYARHDRVKKIAYNPEEEKQTSIVYLPRLSFKLTESQKMILDKVADQKFDSISDMASKVSLSTAMLYRAIDELKDMDLLSTDEGIRLTDAGKIARL